ncbi:MAG: cysteine protease [Deltaproteobacteria bacterium]|nr:cysteine protease [Deltaproteobacteria bacterium]
MERDKEQMGMGWLPDLPDYRDYTSEHEEIKPMLEEMKVSEPEKVSLPSSVDLRSWCSQIENQGPLGSCTAQAGAGLIEYYERRAFGTHIDASRLFLYKTTRNLLGWVGDTGAFLRTTMGAMVLFGVPPEKYWPYTTKKPSPVAPPTVHFDMEPPAFCYAFAKNYRTVRYYRLDPFGIPVATVLQRIKAFLAANMPSMFGFTVFSSIGQGRTTGKIPFPCRGERILGGHGIVAVGYDDSMKIRNSICGRETTGAFLIRNSWGTAWGDGGYGWLPYEYVLRGMARDWWTIIRKEYVPTKQFGF